MMQFSKWKIGEMCIRDRSQGAVALLACYGGGNAGSGEEDTDSQDFRVLGGALPFLFCLFR